MAVDQRKSSRVAFAQAVNAVIMGLDGKWRRECMIEDVSESGAKLTVKDDVSGLDLTEFFLLLSSTGLVYRRCALARHHGAVIGVRFIDAKSAKSPRKPGEA